ncbi:MAG: carboxypeptidase-like regulatory domain-containing protein [Bacteroidota bacterium]|nr:carboxypeptidase-like regulatory domain-containing protein [Bacteroidota bacterium]
MHLKGLLILVFSIAFAPCFAQPVLNRSITMNVNNQRLGSVLQLMEERGKFNFSYNSNLIAKDSLVNIHVANQTVREALNQLLSNRFEYREAGNYVILRYAPYQLSLVTDKFLNEDQACTVSGYIVNEHNGQKLENASVYCGRTLESALTDAGGHFEIRIKSENQPVTLTVSKKNYRDTSVTFLSDIKVTDINPKTKSNNFHYQAGDLSKLEASGVGKFFVSSKQKIQSLNLGGLITQAPFQASLVPGLSTHGSLSGQVVNAISLNLIGGYNAGVDGTEIGIFNLDKSNVKSFQLGVLFNTVGGSVEGIQIAGVFNEVLTDVSAFQFGGAFNTVNGNVSGVQMAVGFNESNKLDGVQFAALNIAHGNVSGVQFGEMNIAEKKFDGVQLSGLFNYAQNLRGIQLGFINASDTSSGVSIGFINLVRNGYHKLVATTNETTDLTLLYKTGTPWLYNVFIAGANLSSKNKLFAYGWGYGNELPVFKFLAFNTEATVRYLNQGNGRYLNLLYRLDETVNIKFSKSFSIMAGPSLNFYYSDQKDPVSGYAFVANQANHHPTNNPKYSRWIGWTVGISIF